MIVLSAKEQLTAIAGVARLFMCGVAKDKRCERARSRSR